MRITRLRAGGLSVRDVIYRHFELITFLFSHFFYFHYIFFIFRAKKVLLTKSARLSSEHPAQQTFPGAARGNQALPQTYLCEGVCTVDLFCSACI